VRIEHPLQVASCSFKDAVGVERELTCHNSVQPQRPLRLPGQLLPEQDVDIGPAHPTVGADDDVGQRAAGAQVDHMLPGHAQKAGHLSGGQEVTLSASAHVNSLTVIRQKRNAEAVM